MLGVSRTTAVAVATIILGAGTVAGASPAAADTPGKSAIAHLRNQIRKELGIKGRVLLGTPVPAPPGAPPSSPETKYYQLKEKVPPRSESSLLTAVCPTGYAVGYDPLPPGTDLWITVSSPSHVVTVAAGYPTPAFPLVVPHPDPSRPAYGGFSIRLLNSDPTNAETATIAWSCVPIAP